MMTDLVDYLDNVFYKVKWDVITDEEWNTFKHIKYYLILKFIILIKRWLNLLLDIKNFSKE